MLYFYSRNIIFFPTSEDIRHLESGWKFIQDDSPEYAKPDFDDSGTPFLNPTYVWTTIPEYKDFSGVAWYRKTIQLKNSAHSYSIYFPYQHSPIEFYVNGKMIIQTDPENWNPRGSSKPGRPALYTIPDSVWKEGENVLALRLYSLDGLNGIRDKIEFGKTEKMKQRWITRLMYTNGLTAIALFIGLYYLFYFIFRTSDQSLLLFGLSSISLSLFLSGITGFALFYWDSYYTNYLSTHIGGFTLAPLYILFLYKFFDNPVHSWTRWTLTVYGGFLTFMFASFLVDPVFLNETVLPIAYLFNLVLLILLQVPGSLALVQKKRYAPLFVSSILLYSVAAVVQIMDLMDFIETDSIIGEGFFIMNVVFALVLGHKQASIQNQLEHANIQLRSLDQLKDSFLASTSHELRTPLQAILSLTEGLKEEKSISEDSPREKDIELILSSVRRLSRYVDDILDLSSIRSGHMRINTGSFPVQSVLSYICDINQKMATQKGLTLSWSSEENLPAMIGDPDRVVQILQNLVGNAIKYTKQGSVEVIARKGIAETIEILVRDTGPGIPERDHTRIFDSFVQLGQNRYGGIGLGLTISQQLATIQNGTLILEQSSNQGSTFVLSMPTRYMSDEHNAKAEIHTDQFLEKHDFFSGSRDSLSSNLASSMEDSQSIVSRASHPFPSSSLKEQANGTGRILLVEDDPVLQRSTSAILENEGYAVTIHSSGEEALERIDEGFPCEVILLDVMLPGISGYETCRRIRKQFPAHKIPILMITAKGRFEDMVEGLDSGASDFLPRPFESHELIARVNNLVAIVNYRNRLRSLANSTADRIKEESERIVLDFHDHLGAKITDIRTRIENHLHQKGPMDPFLKELAVDVQNLSVSLSENLNEVEAMAAISGDFFTGLQLLVYQRYEKAGRTHTIEIDERLYPFSREPEFAGFQSVITPVLIETITNDLKYGLGPSRWSFRIEQENIIIELTAKSRYTPRSRKNGRGTSGIQTRVSEIQGSIHFQLNDSLYTQRIEVPLATLLSLNRA